MDINQHLKDWEKTKSDRATTETEWQQIADIMFPKRDFVTQRTPGTRRTKRIYDSTGIRSGLMLASALHGNLLPVQTRWFYLNPRGSDKAYWEIVQNKMLDIFASPDSRFALQAHEAFLDLVYFGTAVMGVFNSNGRMVFKTFNLSDCWIGEDTSGSVNTLKYKQVYTAEQMYSEFGDSVHENVKKALEKSPKQQFEVLYCVGPRYKNTGRGSVKSSKPFYSIYIDLSNKSFIGEEGGYDDFPFLCPRFSKRSGEIYGYGAGASALSECLTLNEIVEVMLRAAAKNADPPILSPVDGVVLPLRMDPAGINFYNPDVGEPKFWNNSFQPNYMDYLIKEKRTDIEKIFFIDWMTLPNNDRMTATETMQRAQDSFKNMSAINARMESEFLSPLLTRVFNLGVEMGEWSVPPASSQGKDVRIEYTSPVALAQKSISANGTLQGLSAVAQLAQFDPAVVNILDTMSVARDQLSNTYFFPDSYLRDETEVAERVEAQQQAAQSAQAAQNMQGYGSAAKDVADAVTTLGGAQ